MTYPPFLISDKPAGPRNRRRVLLGLALCVVLTGMAYTVYLEYRTRQAESRPPGIFTLTKCDLTSDPATALIDYTIINTGRERADYRPQFVVRDANGVWVATVQPVVSIDAGTAKDAQATVSLNGRSAEDCVLVFNQ